MAEKLLAPPKPPELGIDLDGEYADRLRQHKLTKARFLELKKIQK